MSSVVLISPFQVVKGECGCRFIDRQQGQFLSDKPIVEGDKVIRGLLNAGAGGNKDNIVGIGYNLDIRGSGRMTM